MKRQAWLNMYNMYVEIILFKGGALEHSCNCDKRLLITCLFTSS